ncbi:aminoglycoside phosphotransferase family protein [Brevibacillus porteri]|uniref:Kinase n=1 Tax=Brevibacillus porteri TaxID=2126350 RepID=A0ABX5FS31_9BACL|nr:aminoglycoside phosphotransferase family protein [Brevibacillus porteri]MED1800591.1 aminoglycoside phosphotransferase family protein [Brevibacillus porteri]MED2134781.1 aminoglycoside phosphotransferase family protein [Brevibacillus porteri]MED2745562.1 aminoglycoside phosphotransferase family protein [Brevibacillus porteri]MED2815597.1 aminoglycoside phosphotransferase family protein [Brevibacillus porteri]MED2896374.1 aminoglycoside phosphotransferase family protein [Brevibacillus porter
MISLPTQFTQTIMGIHKEAGRLWLDSFHELIDDCEARWSLKVLDPFPLSYNFVAPVVLQDGRNAVLKLGVPGLDWQRELTAIRAFAGRGMVQLLDADEEKGIMLLERIMPGETLDKLSSEEERIQCLADVIKRMHTPVSNAGKLASTFPTIADWAVGLEKIRPHFQEGIGPIPEQMVERAMQWYKKLLSTQKEQCLLHGDLHHENILRAEREPWLAIDPKGLIGETEYEVIPFLLNHLPEDGVEEVMKQRVDGLTKALSLQKERVLTWAYCHSVLSAWWFIEDFGVDGGRLVMLGVFERLINE